MSCPFSGKGAGPTRRGLLVGAGGALASAGVATLAHAAPQASQSEAELRELFFGPHKGGIATPQQTHSYFAAFDCLAKSRDELVTMLKVWTDAAARMSAGETARDLGQDASVEGPDGASALGLSPGRLTITFGFGAGLFVKDGSDRYGLAAKRSAAFVDLPKFNGDQLEPARTGGDISVQACADDPVVAFHAMRELARLSFGAAQFRWAQAGFMPQAPAAETPRNLMGFKDGTNNPPSAWTDVSPDRPRSFDDVVWVGDEGPDWMRGVLEQMGGEAVSQGVRRAVRPHGLDAFPRRPQSERRQNPFQRTRRNLLPLRSSSIRVSRRAWALRPKSIDGSDLPDPM